MSGTLMFRNDLSSVRDRSPGGVRSAGLIGGPWDLLGPHARVDLFATHPKRRQECPGTQNGPPVPRFARTEGRRGEGSGEDQGRVDGPLSPSQIARASEAVSRASGRYSPFREEVSKLTRILQEEEMP